MSGIFLLVIVGLWLLSGWAGYRAWKYFNPTKMTWKIIHVLVGVLIFSVWLGGAMWEASGKKVYWDYKVRQLCAIDGGVKVYESVVLSASKYDKLANHNWIIPTAERMSNTDEYYSESDVLYYKNADPKVTRVVTRIIRRSDGETLGEYVRYGRGGGDLPGPWHASSYLCPSPINSTGFETRIFSRKNIDE